jgi:hypothetical protein
MVTAEMSEEMLAANLQKCDFARPQQEWISSCLLTIDLSLQSRLHPQQCYQSFQALIRPGSQAAQISLGGTKSTLTLRLSLTSCPLDWWERPDAILLAHTMSVTKEGSREEQNNLRTLKKW